MVAIFNLDIIFTKHVLRVFRIAARRTGGHKDKGDDLAHLGQLMKRDAYVIFRVV